MHVTEQNIDILCEYGRAIIRINCVEYLLKHFLALTLTRMKGTTMLDELKTLETRMLGSKLKVLRKDILPSTSDLTLKPKLEALLAKLENLNNDRILLAHVTASETGSLNTEKEWSGSGEFVFSDYTKRDGCKVQRQPLTVEKLKNISSEAAQAIENIHNLMILK